LGRKFKAVTKIPFYWMFDGFLILKQTRIDVSLLAQNNYRPASRIENNSISSSLL